MARKHNTNPASVKVSRALKELWKYIERNRIPKAIDLLHRNHQLRGKELDKWMDNFGNCLYWACLGYQPALVKSLIQTRADVNSRGVGNRAPIHAAVWGASVVCTQLLLQHGAEVNAVDYDNDTALHWGAREGREDCVRVLLAWKADPNRLNSDGLTAEQVAISEGHFHIAQIIESYDSTATDESIDELKEIINIPEAKQAWSESEIEDLVETCALHVFFAGKYLSGKTSLCKSLQSKMAFTANKDDRTVVMDYSTWDINGASVPVFDLGGHPCYQQVAHLFHANEKNNLNIVTHDITTDDYVNTCQWITDIVSASPKSKIMLVLTKTDLTDGEQQKAKTKEFVEEMKKLFHQEIEMLKHNLVISDRSKEKRTIQNLLDKYEQLCSSLEDDLIAVSCKDYTGLDILFNVIVDMINSKEFTVLMNSSAKNLYIRIGKLGVERLHAMLSSDSSGSDSDREEVYYPETIIYETYPTTDVQKINPTKIKKGPKKVPNEPQKAKSLLYLELNEILQNEYKGNDDAMSLDDIRKQILSDLRKLHSYGLLIWLEGTPKLENYIFNNLSSLNDILKTFFTHNKDELLYQRLPSDLQQYLTSEKIWQSDYDNDLQCLFNEGLLSSSVMKVMAKRCGFDEYAVLEELVNHLNIGYQVPLGDDHPQKGDIFFPWYTECSVPSDNLAKHLKQLMIPNNDFIVHHIVYSGLIPSAWFYTFCVHIYRHILNESTSDVRKFWKNSLFATFGRLNVFLTCKKNKKNEDEMHIYVSTKVESTEGIDELWQFMDMSQEIINNLTDHWWPGLVTSRYLICVHCSIQLKSMDDGFQSCHCVPLEKQLKLKCHSGKIGTCHNNLSHTFPQALMCRLPTDKSEAELCVREIQGYLKQGAFQEMTASADPQSQDNKPGKENAKKPEYVRSTKQNRAVNAECLEFKTGLFYLKNSDITVSIPDDTGCQISEIYISTKPVPHLEKFPRENILSDVISLEPHGTVMKNHLLIKFPVFGVQDKKSIQLMYRSSCSSAEERWINIKQNNTIALHRDEMFWFVCDGYCYLFSRHFSHLFMTKDSLMEPQNGIYLGTSVFAKYDDALKLTVGFHCLRCMQEHGHLEKHTFGKRLCDEEKMCVFEKEGPVDIETKLNEEWESDNPSAKISVKQLLNLCQLRGIYNRSFLHHPKGTIRLAERTKVIVNIAHGEDSLHIYPRITMKEICEPANEDITVVKECNVDTISNSLSTGDILDVSTKSKFNETEEISLQENSDSTMQLKLEPFSFADQAFAIPKHQQDVTLPSNAPQSFRSEQGNMTSSTATKSSVDNRPSSSFDLRPANFSEGNNELEQYNLLPLSLPVTPVIPHRQNISSDLESALVNISEVSSAVQQLAINKVTQGPVAQHLRRSPSLGNEINQAQIVNVVQNVVVQNFGVQSGMLTPLPETPAADCVFHSCVIYEQNKLCEIIDRDYKEKLKEIAKEVGDKNGTVDVKNITAMSLLQVWKVHVHEGKYTWRGFYDILNKLHCQSAAEQLKVAVDKASLIINLVQLTDQIKLDEEVLAQLFQREVINFNEYTAIDSKLQDCKTRYLITELLVTKPCNSLKIKRFFEALNATGYYGEYIRDYMMCPEDIDDK